MELIDLLKFTGTGSAFRPELGNNGTYIKKGTSLFLIDCGSSTFAKLQQSDLLADVTDITVLITHLHPDHAGSLGDLIFYGYYSMGTMAVKNVTVLAPPSLQVDTFLKLSGVVPEFYHYVPITDVQTVEVGNIEIRLEPIVVEHVPYIPCFGYVMTVDGETIYYSGDSNQIPSTILERFKQGEFVFFYQDTCKAEYPGNVHMPLSDLIDVIPQPLRDKVYCMHFDDSFDFERARQEGFNVVSADFR
ncbi:MBL fold metallo-hydrolase [Rossellomorea marisflavi]|uniref:MBL fold metallo-hydrolase n=1 Tax=Rossellomorea marisflavi TaxID=189381 RepID=UPI003F9FFF4D